MLTGVVSLQELHHHNLYQLCASLLEVIHISEMSKFLEKCGDKMNRLFALHIDIPDFTVKVLLVIIGNVQS